MDLKMTRGDTKEFEFTVTKAGVAVNLTGALAWFTAKTSLTDLDLNAKIAKSVGFGITITDAPAGKAVVKILPIDTSSLPDKSTLVWDFQVKDALGNVTTAASGFLAVSPDVTRAIS